MECSNCIFLLNPDLWIIENECTLEVWLTLRPHYHLWVCIHFQYFNILLLVDVFTYIGCPLVSSVWSHETNETWMWSVSETWSCIGHIHTSKVWTWHSFCIYLQKVLCVWSDNHSDGCVSFHLVYGLIVKYLLSKTQLYNTL